MLKTYFPNNTRQDKHISTVPKFATIPLLNLIYKINLSNSSQYLDFHKINTIIANNKKEPQNPSLGFGAAIFLVFFNKYRFKHLLKVPEHNWVKQNSLYASLCYNT